MLESSHILLIEELQKEGKSLNMIHSDEAIFVGGPDMAKIAQEIYYDVAKKLSSDKPIEGITIKFDGAPAVFCGFDPEDGKFFVGTKGIFNSKFPKIAKTKEDCQEFYSGDLQRKMIIALENLPSLFPKGYKKVLQGDMMFAQGDLKTEKINGIEYVTCHPNTIKYAAKSDSVLANSWLNSKIGVIFHTEYQGEGNLKNYKADFGFNIKELNKSKNVWLDDANIKNFSKTMPSSVALSIMKKSRDLSKYLTADALRFFTFQESFSKKAIGAKFATFWNTKIREGSNPPTEKLFDLYRAYVKKYYEEKIISTIKDPEKLIASKNELEAILLQLKKNRQGLEDCWAWSVEMGKMKTDILKVLDSMSQFNTFLQKNDGSIVVTKQEGYVAFGTGNGAIKLVDRFTFSHANFSTDIKKGWK